MLETLNGQEIVEVVTEDKVDAGTQDKQSPPADTKPSEVELLRQEVEKLKKVTVDRGSHINKLRTQLSELKTQASQSAKEAKEIKDEDPLKAAEKVFDSKQAEKQASDLEEEIEFNEFVDSNKQLVLSKFPNFSTMIDDVCEILSEDGIDEKKLSEFRLNPYATSAGILVNLARAAVAKKESKELKQKLESASSQTDQVLKEIETKANRKTLTNFSGGSPSSSGKEYFLEKPVAAMTKEELSLLKVKLRQE